VIYQDNIPKESNLRCRKKPSFGVLTSQLRRTIIHLPCSATQIADSRDSGLNKISDSLSRFRVVLVELSERIILTTNEGKLLLSESLARCLVVIGLLIQVMKAEEGRTTFLSLVASYAHDIVEASSLSAASLSFSRLFFSKFEIERELTALSLVRHRNCNLLSVNSATKTNSSVSKNLHELQSEIQGKQCCIEDGLGALDFKLIGEHTGSSEPVTN
jgi:hypothetical protein